MDANPEFSVPVWPPLEAAFLTSSALRLAKLPGLSLPDMVKVDWVGGLIWLGCWLFVVVPWSL